MQSPHLARPYLDRCWSVYAVGEHEVEMRSLGRSLRLSGIGVAALLSNLLPVLDGRQTMEEVRRTLPEHSRDEADAFVRRLLAQGLLADAGQAAPADTGVRSGSDEWLRALVPPDSLAEVRSNLARGVVAVYGADAVAGVFVQILRDGEIAAVPLGGIAAVRDSSDALDQIARATLVVAFGAGLRDDGLDRVNAVSLAVGTPWLPVANDGIEAVLGPLVLPGQSACLACVTGRADALGRSPGRLVRAGSRPMLPGVAHLVAGIAAAETVRFLIAVDRPALSGAIRRIHLRTLEWTQADVLRLPRCPACGGVGPVPAPERN